MIRVAKSIYCLLSCLKASAKCLWVTFKLRKNIKIWIRISFDLLIRKMIFFPLVFPHLWGFFFPMSDFMLSCMVGGGDILTYIYIICIFIYTVWLVSAYAGLLGWIANSFCKRLLRHIQHVILYYVGTIGEYLIWSNYKLEQGQILKFIRYKYWEVF